MGEMVFLQPRFYWPAVVLLLGFMAGLEIGTARDESVTADEPVELAAGYSYLVTGDFRLNPEHPPLAKLLEALPVLAYHPVFPSDSASWAKADEYAFGQQFFDFNGRRADDFLFAARMVAVFLTACLGLAIAVWTRARFGVGASLLALTLFVLDPNFIAHGRYVKNDVAMTLAGFLACIAWAAFLEAPSRRRLVIAGLVLGIAAATKFSAVFLIPVFAILYLLRYLGDRERFSIRHGAGSLLVAVSMAGVVVWCVYAVVSFSHGLPPGGVHAHPFVEGMVAFLQHDAVGHPSFLLGMHSRRGWWYYFPVAFAVKTPTATLGALVVAAVIGGRELWRKRVRFGWFVLVVPVVVYGAFALGSHINLGIRHLLPIWPFLFILIAAVLSRAGKSWLIGAVVIGLAAETLAIHPYYLSFFNVLSGGPSRGGRILADSNIDWGQDATRLKDWLGAHPVSHLCLDYFGAANLRLLGIQGPHPPATWEKDKRDALDCVAAMSVTSLDEVLYKPGTYAWIRELKPIDRVGYSIYIYDLQKKRPEPTKSPLGP